MTLAPLTSRQRFVRRIAARFFLRFHMSLIFVATVGTALLASRLLFLGGVETLPLRYALAVLAAYGVFFAFIRVGWRRATRVSICPISGRYAAAEDQAPPKWCPAVVSSAAAEAAAHGTRPWASCRSYVTSPR